MNNSQSTTSSSRTCLNLPRNRVSSCRISRFEFRHCCRYLYTFERDLQSGNEAFLKSRLEDPAVKLRELALQSLDLAYFKYKEITRNLDEGNKVGVSLHTSGFSYRRQLSSITTLPEF